MTEQEAKRINQGDTVVYRGDERTVISIKASGIAAPLFRLQGVEDGLTSYRLCQLPTP